MDIIKNKSYQIQIMGMTSEGNGVGKIDGFAVFVPDTAVDDICIVKIVKLNKSYGFGKLMEIIKPSDCRINVDCDRFSQCGGCTYRHITYDAELKIKEDFVKGCFERIGGINTTVGQIIGSEMHTAYRNKAQYPVGKNPDNTLISGFYAKRSHRIIDIDNCKLQPSFFNEIKRDIVAFLKQNDIPVYSEETQKGMIRHIYIRHAKATNEVMVCLVSAKPNIPKMDILTGLLINKYPMIKSIVINVNSENTNVILGRKCVNIYGSESITDIICGIKVKISPLSFYQVNHDQAEVLYSKALEYANLKKTDTLIDLYCGTGTIGLIAAGYVKRLIGVEIVEQAVEDANENAALNGIKNAQFICADASKAATMLAQNGETPDVIIVDPPRKGLDMDVIDAIERMCPKKVVMISCNPATAARDCKVMVEKGYYVNVITPVDMFPGTTHVETCVLLSHKNS